MRNCVTQMGFCVLSKQLPLSPLSLLSALDASIPGPTATLKPAIDSFSRLQARFYTVSSMGDPPAGPSVLFPEPCSSYSSWAKSWGSKKWNLNMFISRLGATAVREINHKHRCVEENQRYISIIHGNQAWDKEFDPHKGLGRQCLDLSTIFTEMGSCSR